MPETMTLKCLVYSFFWRLLVIGALFRIATLSIGQIEEVSIPERDDALMLSRMKYLKEQARKTILVHVHIPKAGGSAMALALSTNCQCDTEIGFRTPDAPYCSRCAQVRGRRGAHLDYSISRATGWKFGVHSPFAVLHWILTESKYTLKSRGLVPVYIIMLRNPFERFLSECKLWTHKDLRAVDWSLTRRNRKTGELLYHPSVKYLHGHRTAERASNITEKDYLMEYASLPQTFIIQNRQTKMIGGTVYDFDMRFNSSKMMGSRWKPRTVRDPDYNMNIFLGKAVKVLSEKKDVILGLQERFAETICTLEIVYGHLYRFDWQSNAHSHNADKSFNLTTIAMASKINTEKYEDVYKAWALNNREDEQLFLVAEKLFDMQFRTAVSVLKLRLENANEATRATLMERTPHCQTLLDQNYNFVS